MIRFTLLAIVSLFLIFACQEEGKEIFVETSLEEVDDRLIEDEGIKAFLQPYKDSLSIIMDSVIGYSSQHLVKKQPESLLGNFMLDATLNYAISKAWVDSTSPTLAMMNIGGLRAPIDKGDITIGAIYKLMPFDNLVVIAKMPSSALADIYRYNKETGGQPIAGFKIEGEDLLPLGFEEFGDTIELITTDYLFNGGDRMDFFQAAYAHKNTGVLLRDVLIDYVVEKDTIRVELDNRINFGDE